MAKELPRILRPLVGNSAQHIKNTCDFVQQIKGITLQANECITSYAVSALFSSVSIDPAINIIRRKLEMDTRTSMKVEQVISLLEVCLKTTYFQFQGRFFEQLKGAAMGSPISLIVANLYMKDFEIKAINTAEYPPGIWKRYVDDTHLIIEATKKEGFLEHINSIDLHIQFTTEDAKANGSIPFLDTIVMPQPDNSLLTTVYSKPTDTDLYLHWNSHHHLSAKFCLINTLKHRAKTVCSNQLLLKKEEDHLNRALRRCKYPEWTLTRASITQKKKTNTKQGTDRNTVKTGSISESYKIICRKHGVRMYFKGGIPPRTSFCTLRTKTTSCKRVEYYTDSHVVGWTVMKNIQGNQAEHLQRGSENT